MFSISFFSFLIFLHVLRHQATVDVLMLTAPSPYDVF